MVFVLILAGLVVKFWPEPALTGTARAVDGDTIRVAGARVRLIGIDAPELAQTCKSADDDDWSCGEAARAALARLLAAGPVECAPHGRDKYRRVLARCSVGGADIGAAMVSAGLAVSYGDYAAEERAARTRRLGLWAGSFERPARFREDEGVSSPEGLPGRLERFWR